MQLGALFREPRGEEENPPQFALAPRNDIAPLICRVVRAMRAVRWRWALGLDSRWGSPLRSVFHPQPPIHAQPLCLFVAACEAGDADSPTLILIKLSEA